MERHMYGKVITAALLFAAGLAAGYWVSFGGDATPAATKPEPSPLQLAPKTKAQTSQADAIKLETSFSQIGNLKSHFERRQLLYALMQGKDSEQIGRYLEQAPAYLSGSEYQSITSILVARLAELHPEAAVERATLATGQLRLRWVRATFYVLALQDPELAASEAMKLDYQSRHLAQQAILAAIAEEPRGIQQVVAQTLKMENAESVGLPFAEQFAQVSSKGFSHRNFNNIANVVMKWAQNDPLAAIEAIQQTNNGMLNNALLGMALVTWLNISPDEGFNWIEANASSINTQSIEQFVQQAGRFDLDRTLALIETMEIENQTDMRLSIASAWLEKDPSAFEAWLRTVTETDEQQSHRIAMHLAQLELPSEMLNRLPEHLTQRLQGNTNWERVYQQPTLVADEISRLPAGEERLRKSTELLGIWASQDPEKAAAWFDQQDSDVQIATYDNLFQNWHASDPDKARAYVERLQDPDLRGLAEISLSPGDDALPKMKSLYRDTTSEKIRDALGVRLFHALMVENPEEALQYHKHVKRSQQQPSGFAIQRG